MLPTRGYGERCANCPGGFGRNSIVDLGTRVVCRDAVAQFVCHPIPRAPEFSIVLDAPFRHRWAWERPVYRLIYGSRVSLLLAPAAALLSTLIASVLW